MKRKILTVVITLALVLIFTSCSSNNTKSKSIAEQIHDDTTQIQGTLGNIANNQTEILLQLKDIESRLKAIEKRLN